VSVETFGDKPRKPFESLGESVVLWGGKGRRIQRPTRCTPGLESDAAKAGGNWHFARIDGRIKLKSVSLQLERIARPALDGFAGCLIKKPLRRTLRYE
jgi:hypothetical protein